LAARSPIQQERKFDIMESSIGRDIIRPIREWYTLATHLHARGMVQAANGIWGDLPPYRVARLDEPRAIWCGSNVIAAIEDILPAQ
jgi:hypothetical protein